MAMQVSVYVLPAVGVPVLDGLIMTVTGEGGAMRGTNKL